MTNTGSGRAALEQAGQEPGGAGLPDDDVDRAAFAADPGPSVGQVQVLDVEREELGRAGGGLVEHPPQGALAQVDVLAGEQLLDLGPGQGAGPVRPWLAALEHSRRVGGEPALPLPVRRGGPDGVQRDVPRRRRPVRPPGGEPPGEPFRVDLTGPGVGAELGHDPAQDPPVGPAGAGLLGAVQGGQVGLGGPAEGDVTGGRGEAAHRSHGRTLSEVMVIPGCSASRRAVPW